MTDVHTTYAQSRPQKLCAAQSRIVGAAALTVACCVIAISSLALAQAGRGQAPGAGQIPGYAGVWYDDTDQGAVEIVPCGERLCGRIVWLLAPLDKTGRPLTDALNGDPRQRQRPICGLPVMGDLKRQRAGTWDEGWIYDPKQGKQFDVELTLRGADTLQVMGYLGIKLLSETFVWKRAPADLKRCA